MGDAEMTAVRIDPTIVHRVDRHRDLAKIDDLDTMLTKSAVYRARDHDRDRVIDQRVVIAVCRVHDRHLILAQSQSLWAQSMKATVIERSRLSTSKKKTIRQKMKKKKRRKV